MPHARPNRIWQPRWQLSTHSPHSRRGSGMGKVLIVACRTHPSDIWLSSQLTEHGQSSVFQRVARNLLDQLVEELCHTCAFSELGQPAVIVPDKNPSIR